LLPSEWPDGGHDSEVGDWKPGTSDNTEITDSKFIFPYNPASKHHAIQRISNRGYFLSATELGHVFDPIMFAPIFENSAQTTSFWNTHIMPDGVSSWPDAKSLTPNTRNMLYGGGNTLRIGRPEHPAFDVPGDMGKQAIGLLDLFHTGQPLITDETLRTGPLINIDGHVNINTASRDALRLLAAGKLVMDPALAMISSNSHAPAPIMAPLTELLELDAPMNDILADKIADAVIASRPYGSTSGLALATDPDGVQIFGNRHQYPDGDKLQWNDSAAEEVFGRVYQSSTVRSRNFRVWVVAQAITPSNSTGESVQILSEVRKTHTIHTDPAIRNPDGSINLQKFNVSITSTNEF
jgi:hypothetical protein